MYERDGLGKDIHFSVIKKPYTYNRFNFLYRDRQGKNRVYKDNKMGIWDLRIDDENCYWFYNKKYDYWTNTNEDLPFDSSTCTLKKKNLNIKSIYRYLKKWNLPAGLKITIENIYFDCGWELITK